MSRRKKHDKPAVEEALPQGIEAPWWLPLLIVAAGLIAYANSFAGQFMLDDVKEIWLNTKIQSLTPITDLLFHQRRPVVALTLALNYAVGGTKDLEGYHVVNLAVHLMAGLVLFGLVRRTLLLDRFKKLDPRSAPWIAAAVAVSFVVHPLQTQSVTYLIQRAESIMALFYLLTIYCVLRSHGSMRSTAWYAAAVFCCGLGMASKAVMVTAPVMVFLFDAIFLSRSWLEPIRRRWPLYAGLAATWFVLVGTGVVGGVLSQTPSATNTVGFSYTGATPLEYALSQPKVVLRYLSLSFWPAGQCLDYSWPVASSPADYAVPLLFLSLLLGGTLLGLLKRSWVGFCGAWFFLILMPTSSFIPIKDVIFEHRMYLPLAAVIVLVVLGARKILSSMLAPIVVDAQSRLYVSIGITLVASGSLAVVSLVRNNLYAGRVQMYNDVVQKYPLNIRAWNNLGTAYRTKSAKDEAFEKYRRKFPGKTQAEFRQMLTDKALSAYSKAIEIDPEFASALANIGSVLEARRQFPEAMLYYQRALKAEPREGVRHAAVGRLASRQGQGELALSALKKAIALKPDASEYQVALAEEFAAQGNFQESAQIYKQLHTSLPDNNLVLYKLGMALQQAGHYQQAVDVLTDLLAREPDHFDARVDLGLTMIRMGNPQKGIETYREVLRAKPDHAPAHYNLGLILQRSGDLVEAEQEYRAAMEADQDHVDAICNLGVVLKEQGRIEEAEASYRSVLMRDARHVLAHYNLGILLHERGDLLEAAEHYQAILAIDPAHQQAQNMLGFLRRRQQREAQPAAKSPDNSAVR